jgi:hypothetical protein
MEDLVIVRNHKNQPVRLSALKIMPTYVLVAGNDRSKAIGFPRDCVFAFDDALFARLREAYENGPKEALSALWTAAKPL